jgi:2-methylisocitrate lyase-like PEP mutase family enzyme
MSSSSRALREHLSAGRFLWLPAVYDPIGARLVESTGFEGAYVGGFVTGGSLAVTEPLLTMTEQVQVAGAAAIAVEIPVLADAGAGFGEPLHTMRTVREFIRAGIAGIHIEDQLYPKRAHYHKYVAHAIPVEDFVAKIQFACRERDTADPDFVIIARTDTCRSEGLDEAVSRINRAAEVGADLGLLFPRDAEEAKQATRDCKIPLVYVQSRGNRDGRPLFSRQELEGMGYVACIDAQIMLCTAFHYLKEALTELRKTGRYEKLSNADFVKSRHDLETLIRLEEYYEIEAMTVEQPEDK